MLKLGAKKMAWEGEAPAEPIGWFGPILALFLNMSHIVIKSILN